MRDRTRTPILDAVRAQRNEFPPGRDPYNYAPGPVSPDHWAGTITTDQRNEAERILSAGRGRFTLEK
jgi:hypothetical protein